ncbi:MAG: hypothetical protein ABIQ21_20290 [Chryseolinea sp.]
MKQNREKELLFKLVFQALVDIREEATPIENKKIAFLSDLVHNVPLKLLKADDSSKTYSSILEELRRRATRGGLENWLENAISQL